MTLQPGALLENGKYRIEAPIGRGGFGYVYRAREQLTGETVAIKELVPSLVGDAQMVQRFIQEARATMRLTHPNIARTYNIFQDVDTYYLAMEYLPGGSLADRLRRGPLAQDEALRIMDGLCAALDYAHRQGVVHCDLKPANVLFDAQGTVRLADFGVAHVSDQLMTRRVVTGTGAAMGTVRYMSPEQLDGVRDDPRVDIYALGAILYEMLAGRPYLDFETETTPAAQMRNIQRIQTHTPHPIRTISPAVPAWLAQVVERALGKTPRERFGSTVELRQALQAPGQPRARPTSFAGALQPTIVPPPPPRVVPDSKGRPQRRSSGWRWAMLGVLAVLVLAMCVGSAILLLQGDDGGSAPVAAHTPRPTATPVPTSTQIPTSEPDTPTPHVQVPTNTPSPVPTPTPSNAEREKALLEDVRWRSRNGTPVFAYRAAQPPTLDGVLEEWAGVELAVSHVVYGPENWQGPGDLSGRLFVSWDEGFLYLGLDVHDERHVQGPSGEALYKGDDVEIQIDVDLLGDFNQSKLSPDDGQVGLAATGLGTTNDCEAYRWQPPALQGPLSVAAAAQPTPGGYVLEVALPWDALNLSPRVEMPYGFALSLADTDRPGLGKQESMVSTSPNRKWGDPTTWGTLILVDW